MRTNPGVRCCATWPMPTHWWLDNRLTARCTHRSATRTPCLLRLGHRRLQRICSTFEAVLEALDQVQSRGQVMYGQVMYGQVMYGQLMYLPGADNLDIGPLHHGAQGPFRPPARLQQA